MRTRHPLVTRPCHGVRVHAPVMWGTDGGMLVPGLVDTAAGPVEG
jgi:hypothetical protein